MAYATLQDVLRALGGTEQLLRERFGRSLWAGPTTPVLVDTLTFDVPDTLIERIARLIESAESLFDGYILHAYKAKPTVVPAHLRDAVAYEAGINALTTDGAVPEYFKFRQEQHAAYMSRLSKGMLDLGLSGDPMPARKRPAPYFASGRGGNCGC